MSNRRLRCAATVVVAAAACGSTPMASPPAIRATAALTDFSFVHNVPVEGARLTACGRVTLSTTNTAPSGGTAFRSDSGRHDSGERANRDAAVTFAFDRPILTFDVKVSQVDPDDFLADFNVGSPPRLSGGLIQTADGRVTVSAGGRDATGVISWPDLGAASKVSFVMRPAPGGVIAVDGFRLSCRP